MKVSMSIIFRKIKAWKYLISYHLLNDIHFIFADELDNLMLTFRERFPQPVIEKLHYMPTFNIQTRNTNLL